MTRRRLPEVLHRNRWPVGLVLATIALSLSGCGGSSPASALQRRLLAVRDLPAGWSAVPASTSKNLQLTDTPCLSGLAAHPKGVTDASAAFVQGTSIPSLGEVLVQGPQAHATWRRLERALALCRAATIRIGATKVQASIHQLVSAELGGNVSADTFTFTVAGIRFSADLVAFDAGRYSGYVSYADVGTPPLATVKAFLDSAIAKANSGSTARMTATDSVASAPILAAHTALGTVAYRAVGAGPPLVLITGYSGTMESWARPFVDVLAERYRVVMLDNAGVGRTQSLPAPLTIDSMANQTSALIDTLKLGRTNVLGWSMGSMIAQALSVLHPTHVRRLILSASFPGSGSSLRPTESAIHALSSGNEQQVLADLFPAGQSDAANSYLTGLAGYPAAPAAPAATVTAQARAVDGWWSGQDPAGRRANTITVPTLIADGMQDQLDPLANSHALARLIRGAKLELYPDAGHAFLFQDEDSFVPLIDKFLG
jgi:pimeloyl-ACP methyl ester carboxylesterase